MDAHPVILIAEDNENDVLMLRRAFTHLGINAPIHIVADGEQAIAYLEGSGRYSNRAEYPLPDLLLLDLKMPRINGFEVLQWVRANFSVAPLRIVVLTTSAHIADINRAYQLGANSFLVKPLQFDDFRNTLRAIYDYWVLNKVPEISRPPLVRAEQES